MREKRRNSKRGTLQRTSTRKRTQRHWEQCEEHPHFRERHHCHPFVEASIPPPPGPSSSGKRRSITSWAWDYKGSITRTPTAPQPENLGETPQDEIRNFLKDIKSSMKGVAEKEDRQHSMLWGLGAKVDKDRADHHREIQRLEQNIDNVMLGSRSTPGAAPSKSTTSGPAIGSCARPPSSGTDSPREASAVAEMLARRCQRAANVAAATSSITAVVVLCVCMRAPSAVG